MDNRQAAKILGDAVLAAWGGLPREAQERIFETAVSNNVVDVVDTDRDVREDLARFLHGIHPRTAEHTDAIRK